jgi:hypothetical protein
LLPRGEEKIKLEDTMGMQKKHKKLVANKIVGILPKKTTTKTKICRGAPDGFHANPHRQSPHCQDTEQSNIATTPDADQANGRKII